jgi:hypothetical protein
MRYKYLHLLLLLYYLGCLSEAERENPFDPLANNSNIGGSISGKVTSFYQTNEFIQSANLLLYPVGHYAISAHDGFFIFNNLPKGNYRLICSKEGYREDSIDVEVNFENRDINFRLNSIPSFEKIELTSHHVNRWWPSDDTFFLRIITQVRDNDGVNEIDSVWLSIPSIAFTETLFISNLSGIYEQTILENNLPLASINQLQGIPFLIYCTDLLNNVTRSSDIYISRIIQEVPVQISPTGLVVINSFPLLLEWQSVFLSYSFTFRIEVYQINFGFFSLIKEYESISSTQTSFTISEQFPSGDYFWLVYIVDDFGNSSSSKEGSFRVP